MTDNFFKLEFGQLPTILTGHPISLIGCPVKSVGGSSNFELGEDVYHPFIPIYYLAEC